MVLFFLMLRRSEDNTVPQWLAVVGIVPVSYTHLGRPWSALQRRHHARDLGATKFAPCEERA